MTGKAEWKTSVALALMGFFMAGSASAGTECNVSGCPGHEAPSLEAQNVAKKVAEKMIASNAMLANAIDRSFTPTWEWRVSPVPPLNYGIMHIHVKGPNGSLMDLPLRFIVADRGLDSLVSSGAFVDVTGEPVDNDQVKITMLRMPSEKPKQNAATIEQKKWAIVHPGKVRVVLFTDPDCPFCAQLRPSIVRMLKEHPEVQLEVYYTPLEMLHPTARAKAKVLLSVSPRSRLKAEGILHEVQSGDVAELERALRKKGINIDPGLKRLAEKRLESGIEIARKAGFGNSTPIVAFVKKRDVVTGAVPYERLVSHLN